MNFRQHNKGNNGSIISQSKPKSAISKNHQEPPPKPHTVSSASAPQRSKSNNDLYYELERTNSAQDLLELINDCAPPSGDMSRYKLMLSECEKFTPTKSKNRNKIATKPINKPAVIVKQQQQSKPIATAVSGPRPTIATNSNNCSSFSYSSSSPRSDSVSMTSGDSLEMISAKANSINHHQVIASNGSEDSLSINQEDPSQLKNNHRRSLSLPSYAAVAEALFLINQQQQQQQNVMSVVANEREEISSRISDFHSINRTENHVEYKNEFKNLQ